MDRLNELIYHTEAAAKMFNHNLATTQQFVQGDKVFVCMMCGNSPATFAKILREIKNELEAASPTKETTQEKAE